MALFITIDGQKITGYGKSGDIEITSYPSIDDQPTNKGLCYWDGSQVQLKTNEMLVAEYAEERIEEMRNLIYTRWIDSSKAVTAMQAQYNNFKTDVLTATSTGEVDTEFDTLEAWLDLSD